MVVQIAHQCGPPRTWAGAAPGRCLALGGPVRRSDEHAYPAGVSLVAESPSHDRRRAVDLPLVLRAVSPHLLDKASDGLWLCIHRGLSEQRLEVRRQDGWHSTCQGLKDGAAEGLHPPRLVVIDEEVEAR